MRKSGFFLLVAMTVLSYPDSTLEAAGITDADWTPMVGHYSAIETDGPVRSLAVGRDGAVYVAGRFNTINNCGAKGVAKWDGRNWMDIGSTDFAEAVAVDGYGNVYLAIDSSAPTFSFGAVVQIFKKWDGTKWTRLGNSGTKFTTSFQTKLSIGKDGGLFVFGVSGSSTFPHNVTSISKWDGKTWASIDSGIGDPWTSAGALDTADHIYVGIDPSGSNLGLTKGIAYWNGAAWSNFETRLDRYGRVSAMTFDKSGNLYVGGTFDSIGGIKACHLARWNGGEWTSLAGGTSGPIFDLSSDEGGNLYVNGKFDTIGGITAHNIARWDGQQWHALGTGTKGAVALAALGNGTLYAGGSFDSVGGIAAKSIGLWTGSSWSALPPGATGPDVFGGTVYACAVDAKKNLYVGGDFTKAGGRWVDRIARWNGATWDSLGKGVSGGISYNYSHPYGVLALAVDRKGFLYAGGNFNLAGGDSAHGIAKWDGTRWNALPPKMYGSVYAISVDQNDHVVVGGQFTMWEPFNFDNIARWDGTSWRQGPDRISSSSSNSRTVMALRTSVDGNLIAGGSFTHAGQAGVMNIARWDGAQWNSLGPPSYQSGAIYEGAVRAIATDLAGNLYIGGYFKIYGDTNRVNLARWNGSNWTGLGDKLNGEVLSLACGNDGTLYAGGRFTRVGSLTANHIAMWDGFGWATLGSGVDGDVHSFALSDSSLFVGGSFTSAGGKRSPNLAKVKITNPQVVGTRPHPPYPAAENIRWRLVKSTLRLSGVSREDRVSIYSINGILLYQTWGAAAISLSGFERQPLILQISRPPTIRFVELLPPVK